MSSEDPQDPAAPELTPAHGVQELIARIRDTGVREAEERARQILEDARSEARRVVQAAREEAEELRAEARRELERDRASAAASLDSAARDAALELRQRLLEGFQRTLRLLVVRELGDPELLHRVVLSLAAAARAELGDRPVEIAFRTEDDARLDELVQALTAETLREGVELVPGGDHRAGARVKLVEDDLELDLSEEAVTRLFLEHLLPRFVERIEGLA